MPYDDVPYMAPPAPGPAALAAPAAPAAPAVLTHAPPEALADAAAAFRTTPDRLATLVVPRTTVTLYAAIVEYAAHFDAPLRVDGYEPTQKETDRAAVGAALALPPGVSSAQQRMSMRHLNVMHRTATAALSRVKAATASTVHPPARPVAVPRYTLSTGTAQIVWPPPAHLTADALSAERARKRRARSSQAAAIPDGEQDGPSDPALADEHPAPAAPSAERPRKRPRTDGLADAPPARDAAQDGALPHGQPAPNGKPAADGQLADGQLADAADAADTAKEEPVAHIRVVHYALGGPLAFNPPDGKHGPCVYRELLLLSPAGPAALRRFADELLQWRAARDQEDDVGMFALQRFRADFCGGSWQYEGMKRARPSASVVLPDGMMEEILDDVRGFLDPATATWYRSHGLPQRRSYMFYGAPGTGKTSTIRVIASTFRLNCCFLSMTGKSFSNEALGNALSSIPPNAMIIIEDVDALFNEDRKNADGGSLTFSGLLNALDGLISVDGIITIMTTNHFDRLDSALVRGGRVDRRFFFDKPSQEQIKALFRSFYPDASQGLSEKFLQNVLERREGDEARAISTLQQLFIKQRNTSAEECVAAMPKFYADHFPTGPTTRGTLYL